MHGKKLFTWVAPSECWGDMAVLECLWGKRVVSLILISGSRIITTQNHVRHSPFFSLSFLDLFILPYFEWIHFLFLRDLTQMDINSHVVLHVTRPHKVRMKVFSLMTLWHWIATSMLAGYPLPPLHHFPLIPRTPDCILTWAALMDSERCAGTSIAESARACSRYNDQGNDRWRAQGRTRAIVLCWPLEW